MTNSPVYPLQVFFDGSCAVCAAEMAAYRRRQHAGRLEFVDISAPEFDPAPYGITMAAFMHELHAIDGENRVYRGVAAFVAIWRAFPGSTWYGFLGTLASLPGVRMVARFAYWGFARVRKFLPKHHGNPCRGGLCRFDSEDS